MRIASQLLPTQLRELLNPQELSRYRLWKFHLDFRGVPRIQENALVLADKVLIGTGRCGPVFKCLLLSGQTQRFVALKTLNREDGMHEASIMRSAQNKRILDLIGVYEPGPASSVVLATVLPIAPSL